MVLKTAGGGQNKGRTTTRDPLATLSLVFHPNVSACYSYSCLCTQHADLQQAEQRTYLSESAACDFYHVGFSGQVPVLTVLTPRELQDIFTVNKSVDWFSD